MANGDDNRWRRANSNRQRRGFSEESQVDDRSNQQLEVNLWKFKLERNQAVLVTQRVEVSTDYVSSELHQVGWYQRRLFLFRMKLNVETYTKIRLH